MTKLLGPLHSVVDRTCTPEAPLIWCVCDTPCSEHQTTELVYSASGEPSQFTTGQCLSSNDSISALPVAVSVCRRFDHTKERIGGGAAHSLHCGAAYTFFDHTPL